MCWESTSHGNSNGCRVPHCGIVADRREILRAIQQFGTWHLCAVRGTYVTDQSKAAGTCAERLTAEGIDLDGYTILEVVDDIEAARRALGYERINFESGSYGTRLAQIYTWRYPDVVRRNAMVAVNPPGRFWWDRAVLEEQILRYSTLCAEDPYCSTRTSNLAASIQTALDNMPKRWLVFPVERDGVLFATFMGLYSTDGAASTFDIWLAAADGDYSGMAMVSAAMGFMLPTGFAWGESASKALSADYDFDPTTDYVAEITPGPYLLGSPGSTMGWAAAGSWPANKIPDEYRTARPSSVETLMLSGTLDVSTPARNARDQLLPLLQQFGTWHPCGTHVAPMMIRILRLGTRFFCDCYRVHPS